MAGNGESWLEIAGFGWNKFEMARSAGKGCQFREIAKNGWKWLEMAEMAVNVLRGM